jgi:hypothetical protein
MVIWGFIGLEDVEERLDFSRVNGLMLARKLQFVLLVDSHCCWREKHLYPCQATKCGIAARGTSIIGRVCES